MPYSISLTDSALRDLLDIDRYITHSDAIEKADHVLSKIENTISSLSQFPERGAYPPELAALGIREFREVFFKPYRIIYRVIGKKVYTYLIADGRRDMQTLLKRRLLDI